VSVSLVHIQFQGGFVGQTAEFSVAKPGEKVEAFTTFEPQDKNDVQVAKKIVTFFYCHCEGICVEYTTNSTIGHSISVIHRFLWQNNHLQT
jgi:cytochrome oxidase Cu insertion factor (SCO1/SenC/PrrC family)